VLVLKRKESEGSSSLDALLKLLPALAMSYPAITSLINQFTGQPQDNRASLQETVPKITQTLSEMDQSKKEELVRELLRFFPELEKLLKQGEAHK
jgi:hypothetical protein